MMKPPYVFIGVFLAAIMITSRHIDLREKVVFLCASAMFAVLFVGSSYEIFGVPLPPYYFSSDMVPLTWQRILDVLISPGRGLIWFTPSFLVVCATPLFVRQDKRLRTASISAVAMLAVAVYTVARFGHWWGGYSYGPRIFQFALPIGGFLALTLVYALSLGDSLAMRLLLGFCVAVAVWEATVHVGGAVSRRGWEWNSTPISVDRAPDRLWDWSDPQFLAPFSAGGTPLGMSWLSRNKVGR